MHLLPFLLLLPVKDGWSRRFYGETSGFNREKVAPKSAVNGRRQDPSRNFFFFFSPVNGDEWSRVPDACLASRLKLEAELRVIGPTISRNLFHSSLCRDLCTCRCLLLGLGVLNTVNTWSISCLVSSNEGCCQPNDDRTSN